LINQGEEVAVQLGFNSEGELETQGYLGTRNGESFTADEINTAYLLASRGSEAFTRDVQAQMLLDEFVSLRPKQQNAKDGE
jgi:hypothetical protein